MSTPQFTLPSEVRETYPLDPDFGPHTKRQRTTLHRLCDVSDDLYEALFDALNALIGLHVATGKQSETAEATILNGQAALAKARGEA